MNLILKFLTVVTLIWISAACDKVCKKQVEEVATIQNITGRDLTLSVCKKIISESATIAVPKSSDFKELSLGTADSSDIRGGPSASCSDTKNGEKVTVGFVLAPKSFNEVKLCYDEVGKRYVVMEKHQVCASGFSEQSYAEPCEK